MLCCAGNNGATWMVDILYKEDWTGVRERFIAWWNREYFGRCALAVTAPRANPPDVAPPPPARTPEERWYDLDWISRREEYRLGRTFFGGEAIPTWNTNDSVVSSLPTILGSPTAIDMDTSCGSPF